MKHPIHISRDVKSRGNIMEYPYKVALNETVSIEAKVIAEKLMDINEKGRILAKAHEALNTALWAKLDEDPQVDSDEFTYNYNVKNFDLTCEGVMEKVPGNFDLSALLAGAAGGHGAPIED
jgi:hypothetical protein